MKDGHMTPRKEDSIILKERESVNTIIVEIHVDDVRVPGATQR